MVLVIQMIECVQHQPNTIFCKSKIKYLLSLPLSSFCLHLLGKPDDLFSLDGTISLVIVFSVVDVRLIISVDSLLQSRKS